MIGVCRLAINCAQQSFCTQKHGSRAAAGRRRDQTTSSLLSLRTVSGCVRTMCRTQDEAPNVRINRLPVRRGFPLSRQQRLTSSRGDARFASTLERAVVKTPKQPSDADTPRVAFAVNPKSFRRSVRSWFRNDEQTDTATICGRRFALAA